VLHLLCPDDYCHAGGDAPEGAEGIHVHCQPSPNWQLLGLPVFPCTAIAPGQHSHSCRGFAAGRGRVWTQRLLESMGEQHPASSPALVCSAIGVQSWLMQPFMLLKRAFSQPVPQIGGRRGHKDGVQPTLMGLRLSQGLRAQRSLWGFTAPLMWAAPQPSPLSVTLLSPCCLQEPCHGCG